jgi:hypothetical protein
MLKKISLLLVLVIAGILIAAGFASPKMDVTREIIVNAPVASVFPHINNSEKANAWMPWAASDPSLKMNYSGPAEGVGSKASWESTGDMGTGEALVVDSVPNEYVKTKLTFVKPFQMEEMATLSVAPVEGGTKVSWNAVAEKPYLFRVVGLFMDCDKMVGGEFEKGLASLKTKLESP